MNKALFSSASDNWETPQDFFDKLDAEFHFTLDPCADERNHKCDTYYTKEQDGLAHEWGGRPFSATRPTGALSRRGCGSARRKARDGTAPL